MAKRGENIYHRRDGRWEGRYIKGRRPDGRPIFGSVYGNSYGEAKQRLLLTKAAFREAGLAARDRMLPADYLASA